MTECDLGYALPKCPPINLTSLLKEARQRTFIKELMRFYRTEIRCPISTPTLSPKARERALGHTVDTRKHRGEDQATWYKRIHPALLDLYMAYHGLTNHSPPLLIHMKSQQEQHSCMTCPHIDWERMISSVKLAHSPRSRLAWHGLLVLNWQWCQAALDSELPQTHIDFAWSADYICACLNLNSQNSIVSLEVTVASGFPSAGGDWVSPIINIAPFCEVLTLCFPPEEITNVRLLCKSLPRLSMTRISIMHSEDTPHHPFLIDLEDDKCEPPTSEDDEVFETLRSLSPATLSLRGIETGAQLRWQPLMIDLTTLVIESPNLDHVDASIVIHLLTLGTSLEKFHYSFAPSYNELESDGPTWGSWRLPNQSRPNLKEFYLGGLRPADVNRIINAFQLPMLERFEGVVLMPKIHSRLLSPSEWREPVIFPSSLGPWMQRSDRLHIVTRKEVMSVSFSSNNELGFTGTLHFPEPFGFNIQHNEGDSHLQTRMCNEISSNFPNAQTIKMEGILLRRSQWQRIIPMMNVRDIEISGPTRVPKSSHDWTFSKIPCDWQLRPVAKFQNVRDWQLQLQLWSGNQSSNDQSRPVACQYI
ncbi:hypothetical protein SISNIDRAFT_487511 [Sistotremastrum niveocremeum HHB9708]|uniref:Uncharacterized protein n=1 Tax=Sistotremastrum niveocremeum HHB9708 TaxID=1314777 RepID=A0A164S5I8_9AGAM|nr:hypothetical protein SISNIDRAFT_487511 [Sistotremastrum niveocremeum HHB9708]